MKNVFRVVVADIVRQPYRHTILVLANYTLCQNILWIQIRKEDSIKILNFMKKLYKKHEIRKQCKRMKNWFKRTRSKI